MAGIKSADCHMDWGFPATPSNAFPSTFAKMRQITRSRDRRAPLFACTGIRTSATRTTTALPSYALTHTLIKYLSAKHMCECTDKTGGNIMAKFRFPRPRHRLRPRISSALLLCLFFVEQLLSHKHITSYSTTRHTIAHTRSCACWPYPTLLAP